jgi:hypothetical protein
MIVAHIPMSATHNSTTRVSVKTCLGDSLSMPLILVRREKSCIFSGCDSLSLLKTASAMFDGMLVSHLIGFES